MYLLYYVRIQYAPETNKIYHNFLLNIILIGVFGLAKSLTALIMKVNNSNDNNVQTFHNAQLTEKTAIKACAATSDCNSVK